MIRSWHFNVCNYFHILGEILTVFSLFQCIWSHHRLQKLTGVTVSYINYYQIKLLITKKLMDYQLPNLSQRNSSMLVSWNVCIILMAQCKTAITPVLSHQYDLCDIVVIVGSAWWCWWPGTSLVPVHLLPGLWCVLVNTYQGSSAEI